MKRHVYNFSDWRGQIFSVVASSEHNAKAAFKKAHPGKSLSTVTISKGYESKYNPRRKRRNPRKSRQVEMVHGIDFTKDFYTLPNSDVVKLVEAADSVGYRKPKNANGSRGRYYFYAVKRKFKLNPRKRRTKRRSR